MVTLFSEREPLDLATRAIRERDDVREADVSEAAALTAWEAKRAARVECQRDMETADEGGTSPPRHRDPLRAQEAADALPGLLREEKQREREYRRAVLHREAVERAARAECRAARVAGRKALVRNLSDALDAVVPVNAALVKYEAETAALLGGPLEPFDSHAWAAEFDGDKTRESVLEFRKRRAVEAGLL
jgi:hypothetical protein